MTANTDPMLYKHLSGKNPNDRDAIISNYMAKLEGQGLTVTTTSVGDSTSGNWTDNSSNTIQWSQYPQGPGNVGYTYPQFQPAVRPFVPSNDFNINLNTKCALCQKEIDYLSNAMTGTSGNGSSDLCVDCIAVIPTTKELVLIIGKLLATIALGAEEDEAAIEAARAMIARLSTKELIRDECKEPVTV